MGYREVFADGSAVYSGAGASPEAIRFHYDTGTEFFRSWLGDELVYSAGRWREPLTGENIASTLEDAQAAKLDFHLDAVGCGEGKTLLDIGCGWGAAMRRAIARFNAARTIGITLSSEQFEHVRAQKNPRIEVHLQSWEDVVLPEPVDGAISIGAFEHFAQPHQDRARKVSIYRDFFERTYGLLKPAGRLSLQTIYWQAADRALARAIVPNDVFPESDLPYLDEALEAAQPFFRVRYLETSGEDYTRTLREWLRRLRQAHEAEPRLVDRGKFAFHENYLRRCIVGFARDRISLARIVFERL